MRSAHTCIKISESQIEGPVAKERKSSVHDKCKHGTNLKSPSNCQNYIFSSPSTRMRSASKDQIRKASSQSTSNKSNSALENQKKTHTPHKPSLINHSDQKKPKEVNVEKQLNSLQKETKQRISALEDSVKQYSAEISHCKGIVKEKDLLLMEISNLKKENKNLNSELDLSNQRLKTAEDRNMKMSAQLKEHNEEIPNREFRVSDYTIDSLDNVEERLKAMLINSSKKYAFLHEDNIHRMKILECTDHLSKLLQYLQKELEYQQQKYNQLFELHNVSLVHIEPYSKRLNSYQKPTSSLMKVKKEDEERGATEWQERRLSFGSQLREASSKE